MSQVTYESRYNGNTKNKAEIKSARDLKNVHNFAGNLAEGLGSGRERCWSYVSIYENTPKKLPHLSPKS